MLTLLSMLALVLVVGSCAIWMEIWKYFQRTGAGLKPVRGTATAGPGVMLALILCWIVSPLLFASQYLRRPTLSQCSELVAHTLGRTTAGTPAAAFGIGVSASESWLDQISGPLLMTCLGSTFVLLLAPLVLRTARRPWNALGFGHRRILRQINDGCLGFVASIVPVTAILIATATWRKPETQHALLKLLTEDQRTSIFAIVILTAVILAPLVEELVFRVGIQGYLQTVVDPKWAIGFVAVLFSLVHGALDAIALLPLALIMGVLFYIRNSYISVVVVHLLFNGANVAMALLLSA